MRVVNAWVFSPVISDFLGPTIQVEPTLKRQCKREGWVVVGDHITIEPRLFELRKLLIALRTASRTTTAQPSCRLGLRNRHTWRRDHQDLRERLYRYRPAEHWSYESGRCP